MRWRTACGGWSRVESGESGGLLRGGGPHTYPSPTPPIARDLPHPWLETCTVGSREAAPPSMAVVEVRTRVTEPRTGDREKSGVASAMMFSHSSGESSLGDEGGDAGGGE
jgi:hypothetical protein